MARSLNNRTIIITGASSGIGAATALACARRGMPVLLNGRKEDKLAEVARQVRTAGGKAEVIAGDVTQPGLNEHLLDVADEALNGFYAVFANAGYGWKKPAHTVAMDDLRAIFEVNFFAAYDLIARAARRLLAREENGHLLMCSSAVAKFTMINFSAYSATKAAQNHVCRAMRLELRPHGIAVSSVHPITTRTDFFVRSAEASGEHDVDPDRVFDHVPDWMLQSPQQVADAVVRCLRKPVPEVWTSRLVRMAAGLITAFPRLADSVGKRG